MATFSIRRLVVVPSPAPLGEGLVSPPVAPDGAGAASKTDAKPADVQPERSYVVATALLVVLGIPLGSLVGEWWGLSAIVPPDGVSVFAAYYMVALVIERLQEPFAPWVGQTKV